MYLVLFSHFKTVSNLLPHLERGMKISLLPTFNPFMLLLYVVRLSVKTKMFVWRRLSYADWLFWISNEQNCCNKWQIAMLQAPVTSFVWLRKIVMVLVRKAKQWQLECWRRVRIRILSLIIFISLFIEMKSNRDIPDFCSPFSRTSKPRRIPKKFDATWNYVGSSTS